MKKTIFITVLIFLLGGCAANKQKINRNQQSQIPPGVDSLVAIRADSLSNLFFVDFTKKMKAINLYKQSKKLFEMSDSLWLLFQNKREDVTAADSSLLVDHYWRCYLMLKPDAKPEYRGIPETKKAKSLALDLCREAQHYSEQARQMNPFDLNNRLNLIKVLMLEGRLTKKKYYYRAAIRELTEFLNYEKSEDEIYNLLAECYYALEDWQNAYKNYNKAQHVLERTVIFQYNYTQNPALDTTKLVYYLQQQGDTRAKLYDDINALRLLRQALELTNSPEKKNQIQKYIDWINWDDGNIRAVEKRDAIYELYKQKNYKKANKEFKKLLKILKTQRTRDQINWFIATIDFEILNNKKEGIKRLYNVISAHPPADSTITEYLNDYGAMCYSLGKQYLGKKEYKIAYAYFKQASKIDWERKGESFFQLAQLSQSNAQETIKNCQQALKYARDLSPKILNQTYKLLVNAYKKSGEFRLAREYYCKLTQ